jgi:hypothetical protein
MGEDYTFFGAMLVLAALCLIQAQYQWRVTWGVIFALYLLASLLYSGRLILDVIAQFNGQPQVLLDLDDSVVFVVFVVYVVAVTWLLYRARPWRARRVLSSNNALEQTRDE